MHTESTHSADSATAPSPASSTATTTGAVSGGVRAVLRLEGLSVLIAALTIYHHVGFSRGTFAWFILLPDVSFLGYLAGARIGALSYNLAHSLVGAVACATVGVALAAPTFTMAGLIWLAHIGMDRSLGYGLKYTRGFGFTHLGRIGKTALGEH